MEEQPMPQTITTEKLQTKQLTNMKNERIKLNGIIRRKYSDRRISRSVPIQIKSERASEQNKNR